MSPKKTDVLREVDDPARRLAKTLVRTARYAALGTLESPDGAPAVSRIAVATAMDGDPVFLISRLSGHFGNLKSDARCSLLVGEPGKGDPLAHPRLTLIGAAKIVGEEKQRAHVKRRYLARHPKAALYVDFADFAFWRFDVARASLNGGFGKAYALTKSDLATAMEGNEALGDLEESAVTHMNGDHADAIQRYAALAGVVGSGLAAFDARSRRPRPDARRRHRAGVVRRTAQIPRRLATRPRRAGEKELTSDQLPRRTPSPSR